MNTDRSVSKSLFYIFNSSIMLDYSTLLRYPDTNSGIFETKLSDSSYSYNEDLFRFIIQ